MPNRMLRDWTGSDRINNLSVHAERFFVRLIMKVDDFGCFYADPRLVKANLFPLLLDNIREADLLRWMAECQKAGLIVLYESEGKKYVQVNDFRQRLDKAKSKFPLPVNGFPEVVNEFPAELEVEQNRSRSVFTPPTKQEVYDYFLENGYSKDTAETAFKGYDVANWHDSKGNKIKNWKQKMVHVWFKPEHKLKTNGSNLAKAVEALKQSERDDPTTGG